MDCELSRIEVEPQCGCHTGEACDESLCGDLSALNTRLERLEKAAAKGLAVPISAAPAAPAAPAPAAPTAHPEPTPAPPAEPTAAPTEESTPEPVTAAETGE